MSFKVFTPRRVRIHDASQRTAWSVGAAQMAVALMIGAGSIAVTIWSMKSIGLVRSVELSEPTVVVATEVQTDQRPAPTVASVTVASVSPRLPRKPARIHPQHDLAKRLAPRKDQDKPGPTMFDECNASTLRLRLCTASGEFALANIKTYKRRA